MAFRKRDYGVYRSPLSNSSSFGEVEFTESVNSDGLTVLVKSRVTSDELSKRTLNLDLFSAENVLKSGKVITGTVSLAPTDPDNIERTVERGLRSYIVNNSVSPSNPE